VAKSRGLLGKFGFGRPEKVVRKGKVEGRGGGKTRQKLFGKVFQYGRNNQGPPRTQKEGIEGGGKSIPTSQNSFLGSHLKKIPLGEEFGARFQKLGGDQCCISKLGENIFEGGPSSGIVGLRKMWWGGGNSRGQAGPALQQRGFRHKHEYRGRESEKKREKVDPCYADHTCGE